MLTYVDVNPDGTIRRAASVPGALKNPIENIWDLDIVSERLEMSEGAPTGAVYRFILTVDEITGMFTRTEAIAILDSTDTVIVDYLRLLSFFGGTIDVNDGSNDYATFINQLRTLAILATDARRDDLLLGKLIV